MSNKDDMSKKDMPDYKRVRLGDGREAIIDRASDNLVVETFGHSISGKFVHQRLVELWKKTL